MPITERIVYETSDGKRHDTREVAEQAEREIQVRAELAALTDEDGDRYGDYRDSDPVNLIMMNALEIFEILRRYVDLEPAGDEVRG